MQALHLTITGLAALPSFKLKAANRWVYGSKDTNFPGDLESALDLLGAVYIIHFQYLFQSRYKIVYHPDRIGKRRDSLPDSGTNWYTGGSKLGDATGAGYYCRQDGKDTFISIGKHATDFQEIFAIQKCAERILELKDRHGCINIRTDSQAALKALEAHKTKSALVRNCEGTATDWRKRIDFDQSGFRLIL